MLPYDKLNQNQAAYIQVSNNNQRKQIKVITCLERDHETEVPNIALREYKDVNIETKTSKKF
ncbi:8718_t:CDS:2 [Gigaspora margarita]|uniref:8718_t:CDS:1 n=1 Tax=Gigaspora margarita TaxID=4874 RepID=A0ABM8VWM3_GIGMA|nr:8718_t:CDS:2 [Gigaspora margarita]